MECLKALNNYIKRKTIYYNYLLDRQVYYLKEGLAYIYYMP